MTAKHPQKLPPPDQLLIEVAQFVRECPESDPLYKDGMAAFATLMGLREDAARYDELKQLNAEIENDPCVCSHVSGLIDSHLAQLSANTPASGEKRA